MGLRIENGGILTTVQDGGRFGYEAFGVCPSGPMDEHSFYLANLLAGNAEGEACLELTFQGPGILFTEPAVIAVTGADMGMTLNGRAAPMYQAIAVNAGDSLAFGIAKTGCRAYLAVSGGFDIAPVMGSRSTLLKQKIGGYDGRKLKAGDELFLRVCNAVPEALERRKLPPEVFSSGSHTVRVVMGPQDDCFTKKGLDDFLGSVYTVSQEADRMGYRLEGTKIEHKTDGNIISDGIVTGSVQVPTSGYPIIMMADRQTIGGYTKIATVITVDIPVVGQCRAGDKIRFQKVSVAEAQELLNAEWQKRKELTKVMRGKRRYRRPEFYRIQVDGRVYEVKLELEEESCIRSI